MNTFRKYYKENIEDILSSNKTDNKEILKAFFKDNLDNTFNNFMDNFEELEDMFYAKCEDFVRNLDLYINQIKLTMDLNNQKDSNYIIEILEETFKSCELDSFYFAVSHNNDDLTEERGEENLSVLNDAIQTLNKEKVVKK